WLTHYYLRQLLKLLTAQRLDFHFAFPCLLEQRRICHGFGVRVTQYFDALFRRPGRSDPRSAEITTAQDHIGDVTALIWSLFLVEDRINGRRVRNSLVAVLPPVQQHADKIVFAPGGEGLASEKRCGGHTPALHLALFHSQVDLTPAGITQHGFNLETEGVFQH